MGHSLTLSDEQYETLRRAAQERGQTPDALLAALVEDLRDPYTQPRYHETEDFLRRLGAGDEENAALDREAAEEVAGPGGTNADA